MVAPTSSVIGGLGPVGSAAGLPRSPADQFGEIFLVFVILGTLVGIVVIGYTLLNAYKYRDGSDNGEKAEAERPQLGEKPGGSGGGKKLFLSFGISAVIVLSLIIWTYTALLYVEDTPEDEDITIEVEGQQFNWNFVYPNGENQFNELRLPANSTVKVKVTSTDVFHNFGIPEFAVKADAIPGQTTEKWFVTQEPGTYGAFCYELCGQAHSEMNATVIVMEQDKYEDWYAGDDENTQAAVTVAGEDS